MIDEKKAQNLISQGEGQHIEFKENVPSKVKELSEEVCAFANSSGGYVLIGVNDNQGFSDTTIDNSKRSAIQDSLDSIEPKLDCELYSVTVEGHIIWVIEVPEGNEKPYFSSGSVFVRRGATITVELFDDRLEISNPGGLLPPVAKDFGHKSLSRNPKIFELFTRMHLVEKVGSGIPRMSNLMEEAHLPAPIYKTEGFFTVILYKATSSPEFIGNKEKSKEKSKEKNSEKILRLITDNPRITTAELALECGLSDNTIYKVVRKLREAGQIYRKGGDKGGEWIVVQK